MTQERKDQLYDEMLGWICEHINNDEDLYITLHKHFGMTKEELHENCIESLDAFFPKYPISEKRAMLIEKIDEEYNEFLDDLNSYDADNIITSAEYILAMKRVHEYIHEDYIIKDDQIDYFLKLEKPLEAICDWYSANEIDIIDDLNHAIWEIVDKDLYTEYEQDVQHGGMEMN